MTPYYEREGLTLHLGDCRSVLAEMEPCSVDAIVTDPPYGIHFMGKSWDKFGGPLGLDHQLGRERSGSMHAGEYDYSKNAAFQDWTNRTTHVPAITSHAKLCSCISFLSVGSAC